MWYENAKPHLESGDLAILGVVQEQHAERAKLYRQWKQLEFSIVQDATTSLNLNVVPVAVLIDEYGTVRDNQPRPDKLNQFVNKTYQPIEEETFASSNGASGSTEITQVDQLISEGNKLLHSRNPEDLSSAVSVFKKAVEKAPDHGKALFSLGVSYRARFDSQFAETGDFDQASKHWSRALATNPNQYIWRRRIEQYGPKRMKPYPFYDWIDKAAAEIAERGEEPIELQVSLTGSERAKPARNFSTSDPSPENPDPESKITLDEEDLIVLQHSNVPSAAKKGEVVRVYLHLHPKAVKWNREAGPIQVWIDEDSNGTPEKRLIEHPVTGGPDSKTNQSIDFEFKTDNAAEKCEVKGFVLFNVCDDEGVCFFHRKNFVLALETR